MTSPLSSQTTPTVVFFGATGGVVNAALVHTLKAGYRAIALVRNPEKLRAQLARQGVDEALIHNDSDDVDNASGTNTGLTIVQGNALDLDAVKRTLSLATTGGRHYHSPGDWHIVTGLGGSPKLTFDWCHPGHIATLDDPTICEKAARTLLTALREVYHGSSEKKNAALEQHPTNNKPLLTFVSTTGVTRGVEDVPFVMRFLYHQMLAIPHADKKKMEDLYRAEAEKSGKGDEAVVRNVVGIRPTLLSGGVSCTDAVGLHAVRSGTEDSPAIGYSIKRADVGHWIFENVIDQAKRRKELEGQMITLTT
ncbi:hypothetical protein A1O1_00053 [Capronia coronata CBS 617.96]|uniref:NAD(P)-binding domain-containing protein n=1 Tax=Capronia coronata CBS 617.96 TaxID=1182541 RepID=W9YZ37_9EURO|nr:uncharacterized protein A1O1_00053 [Capronia coronata CBS 617.96]EXJ94935.1 hypothetical protein A1O1_00053 [Capronia coronata CBS 617.96]